VQYTSNAEWPDCVNLGKTPNVSTDEHDNAAQAQSVCDRLEREGLGGEHQIFPIRTWVEQTTSGGGIEQGGGFAEGGAPIDDEQGT